MFKRITNLLKTNTFQGIAIVTGGLFVGNVLSYLLQILLARFLSVSEYGIFTVLLSLSYIFTIPSTGVSNAIIKLVSELRAAGRFENLTAMFWKISALAFISGVAITAGLLAFRVPLAAYLNLESPNLFFYFGIFLVFLLLIVIPTAYLQGLLRFKDFAIFVIVGGLLRVLFPLILIFSGFGVRGVFVGMGLGFGFAYLCALLLLKKNFTGYTDVPLQAHFKRLFQLSYATLLISVGMIILNNIDVVMVKHYFDAHTAGIYSALVTVGKVLLFGAGTVSVVMFPQISELTAKNISYKSKFKQFLVIQVALILAGIAVFSVMPYFVTNALFGSKFILAAQYLPAFSVFVGLYVLINFMTLFMIAIDKHSIFIVQLPVILLQVILIYLFHTSLNQIILVNITVTALALLLIVLYYVRHVGFSNNSGIQKTALN